MKTFFDEKPITVTNEDGKKLEFFMRPIKVKELQTINRVGLLAENADAEEFSTPLLLSLVIDCLSIGGENIPATATEKLIEIFVEYNFPEIKEKEADAKQVQTKAKEHQPLSFFIDFLVNQGHSVPDIMEMTLVQFNELVKAASDRLTPPDKKPMDAATAFRNMGIPIKQRDKSNGR